MATLFCTRSTCLRAAFSTPHTLRTAHTLSTAVGPLTQSSSRSSAPTSRLQLPLRSRTFSPIPITISRKESTSATTTSPSSSSANVPDHLLTWDRFFQLRRKRRWLNLGCSAITSVSTVGIVTPIIAAQDFDAWGAQISGLDPIIVLGISTFAVAAGGWLCGPSFGNLMFSIWAGRRGWKKGIAEKEVSFFARIKRYRADPSASSPQNPIPDYYGEKIGSVKDYRRWLKDQKAFNLKKNKSFIR